MKNKLLHFILTFFTLLFYTNVDLGQAPLLGTDSTFALFTANGAFSSVGATTIWGDIGTNLGAYSGSPTLYGTKHIVDSVAIVAATDIDNAYTYLSSITCDTAIGTTLGNGQVLTPKVYCLGAVSSLNGTLTLDGQGNPGAIFIFKINGAFSTNTSSHIVLINSASILHLYWQINGGFILGDSSVFLGTIIANGAISLLDSSVFYGRGLTRSGAINLHNSTMVIATQAGFALPITLLSFNAQKNVATSAVNLNWQTASEINTSYFLIERSTDGVSYQTIGKRNAAGNSRQLLFYSYTDKFPQEGTDYYRLNECDINGTHTYSVVRALSYSNIPLSVKVYPDPFTTSITIDINNAIQITTCELKIYNVLGIKVISEVLHKQINIFRTDKLPSGIYFYKIVNNNEIIRSGKLISQNI